MYANPFDLTPEKLADEALTLQQKLGAGLATLGELDDVHYDATDKQEVWRDGKVVLYRFKGPRAPTAKVPILICYALVNRPYMVDLQDDRSLVKNLLAPRARFMTVISKLPSQRCPPHRPCPPRRRGC